MNSRTIMLFNIWFVQLVLSGACKAEGSSLSHVRYDKSKSPSKILTNRNTVNEFEPNDTQSQKSNISLNLDPSLYDRELDSENIPPSKENTPSPKGSSVSSPNKSSYSSYFKYEGGSPPSAKTDKSKSPSKILINRNAVNEFEPNDTQSQKSNISLNLDTSFEVVEI